MLLAFLEEEWEVEVVQKEGEVEIEVAKVESLEGMQMVSGSSAPGGLCLTLSAAKLSRVSVGLSLLRSAVS